MIFKIGDVLGYNNGYHAIITDINNDDIDLDLSDGSRFIIKTSKLINGEKCPCADKLRRLYLTKPRHNQSEIQLKRRIEIGEKEYQKCYND